MHSPMYFSFLKEKDGLYYAYLKFSEASFMEAAQWTWYTAPGGGVLVFDMDLRNLKVWMYKCMAMNLSWQEGERETEREEAWF